MAADLRRDRALGAYIGAAIGDAMGGPVEAFHADRIKRYYGTITTLIPYQKPPGLIDLQPGYALRPDPGAITDDTFIRADFTRFLIENKLPRTPHLLATWLVRHADFSKWWEPMTEPLYSVAKGAVSAEAAGLTARFQGGGAGWWTPIGIIYAGKPEQAAAEARNLCRIWKAPLEQDLNAAVQAGVAEAQREGASVDSVLEVMFAQCRSLAQALLERGVAMARKAKSSDELIELIYQNCLVGNMPTAADAPLPRNLPPVDYTDEMYASILFAEQIPLALAAFVFAEGDPARAIPQAVNFGRDADSVATTVGSLSGGLYGEAGLPKEWVTAVLEVNRNDIDIRGLAEQLLELEA